MVFDYHHDWIFPSSEPPSILMPRILATWNKRGIKPKQHLSEPRPGAVSIMERRAHSDRCKTLPPDLPDDMDLMLEAKDKEQAVLEMYRIYDLQPTNYSKISGSHSFGHAHFSILESLRPPADEESLRTKGRKSRTPKKKKTVDGAEDEEGLEDAELLEDGTAEAPATTPKRKRKAPTQKVKKELEDPDENTSIALPDVSAKKPARKRASKIIKEDLMTRHPTVDEGAATLTGLPAMPEGFTGVDGEIKPPEAEVVSSLVEDGHRPNKKAKIEA